MATATKEATIDGISQRRPPAVGFIAPNVHGYFFGSILTGVIDTASAQGARIVAIQTHDAGLLDFEDERFASQVSWDHLDALVVAPAAVDSHYVQAFAATGKPVVTVYEAPSGCDCPTVVPDNEQGVRASLDHLVGHGHTRIAFVGRQPANADDSIRYEAYRQAMLAHGLLPTDQVPVPWRLDETYDGAFAVRRLRELGELPTAVVACTDATAMAFIEALAADGVVVPDDVAVVGFDDIPEAAEHHPPLSTVAQSFTLAGSMACALALRALRGDVVEPGLHRMPVTFVVRESCGCRTVEAHGDGEPSGLEGLSAPFVRDLGAVLYGEQDLTPTRQDGLRVAAQHLLTLFGQVLRTPEADLGAAEKSATDALRHVMGRSSSPLNAVAAVRGLAVAVTALLAPGDAPAAAALDRRAVDVTARALQSHRRQQSGAVVNQHVEVQRRYHRVSTELVRRHDRDVRSLTWLSGTDVPRGSLALWNDNHELRIVGVYPDEGGSGRRDEPCDVRAFPPASRHEEIGPDALTLVVPLRFDGSDHGFLALTGPFDVMEEAVFERFNHWAVLLAVALDQDRAVERLRVSEERYALAAEAANDGMWDWDLGTGVVYYSARWKALLGFTEDEIGATSHEWLSRVHPADRVTVDRALSHHLNGRDPALEVGYRLRTADGTYRWMITNALSVRDTDGTVTRLVGSMTDVTERQQLEEQLRHDAHYDLLTGLPNRALFLERLNQAILRTQRHADYQFAVVFLDLDGFKVVNDSLGHQVGDELLIQVARRLSSEVRVTDTVSRFGGDEFALLIDDVQDIPGLPEVIRRLLSVMSVPVVVNEGTRTVSAAAGIAVSAVEYESADEYLRDADTAMYRAKAQGPGSVVLFDTAMHARAMARLQMESALDQGIAEDQFELYYQPIVRLDTRRIVGLEALIRWHHPQRGLVPPDDFLPVAEATGHTRPIGLWTIAEACRQIREWRDAVPGFEDCTVSVNLSNRQFWDPDLRPTLRAALDRFDVPASSIVFEVTEGVIMHYQDVAVSFLGQLREEGVEMHVDDFGTGHSSLSALHELPVGALKIDRSFVQRMQTSRRSRELVGLMVTMGARFGLDVIAEGIETEAEAATLAELGCPFAQGFLFARPMPAADATRLLLAQAALTAGSTDRR
ncbi:EAL domain-containing protein [Cellulomonas sp. S1-8]|uniref:EAL domain-containing protein n=1 Tax=Cellulomonas sp. S1-8 TaxID=2904790 RepID=UPI0022432411|nr:EAL domain-containing protein [Cellulomonas sp. S1-8]UZN04784.1 EAL domain-containing protein [Cellulomonas sp. S1-8]